MSEFVTEFVDGKSYQYYPLGDYALRAVGVCGGRPTFKYSRIENSGTLERLAAGYKRNSRYDTFNDRQIGTAPLQGT